MPPERLKSELTKAKDSKDFESSVDFLAEELERESEPLASIETILRFMEENPEIEYGSPGSLVHFMEEFYGRGYEGLLFQSASRHPTPHIIWMVNRILNGPKNAEERNQCIAILRAATNHPLADQQAKSQARRFLARAT